MVQDGKDAMKNENNPEKQEPVSLYDTLLKQQEVIIRQSDMLQRMQQETSENVDLSSFLPRFLRKKKEGDNSGKTGMAGNINVTQTIEAAGAKSKSLGKRLSKAFNDVFIWLGLSILRYFWLVFFAALVGGGVGVYVYFTADPVYESEMTLAATDQNTTFYNGYIVTLDNLVQNQGYADLANKLQLTLEEAKSITKIEFGDYIERGEESDASLENDSTIIVTNRPFFRVIVGTMDNSLLPKIEAGLIDYIVNNPYAKRRRDVRRELLQSNLSRLDQEIMLMDSLKGVLITSLDKQGEANNEYFVREGGPSGLIFSQDDQLEVNPLDAFARSKAMYQERQGLQRSLLLIDNEVDLIDGLAAFDEPVFPRIYHVIMYGIYGLILGLILAVGLEFMKVFLRWRKQLLSNQA